ncbi:MAG: GNAT family N-acetyltransferase [Caldilineaceae bacterium]
MKPILRDFPDHFESERLLIRGPRPGDGPELNAAVIDSLAELKPWMPWAQKPPTLEESEENARRGHVRFMTREDLWLLLFSKGTHTMVGGSGLHRIDWDIPSFEIGYWVRTPYAGQGYITEAVAAITDFAFDVLGARRVFIKCDAKNERSAAVARRLDFSFEGTLHCDTRDHFGNLRDTLVFAKVRKEE